MTNEALLRSKIKKSGYKMQFIAESIGLTYQGFFNKLTGKYEFNAREIVNLCKLLNISSTERDRIFFAKQVDKTST